MRWFGWKILASLLWFMWSCVIIPGHTRGAYTVPSGEGARGCCGSDSASHSKTPTPKDRAHCAVCYFAFGLGTPPPLISAPSHSGTAVRVAIEILESLIARDVPKANLGRDPPQA